MATENARTLWTERATGSAVATTELNSLADDAAAVGAAALSNGVSTERNLLADFLITIALQGGARTGSPCRVGLVIVPEVNGTYGDIATLATASNYIARFADGTQAYRTLDAATTARSLTLDGVQLPNCSFKVGVLNESGQALAASGNSVFMSGRYQPASVTV